MAAWRKEKEDVARHRQEKREVNEMRNVVIVQGSVEPPKRQQTGPVPEPKESCIGTRRTETCVERRHDDVLLDAPLAICSYCSLCFTRLLFDFVLCCFSYVPAAALL